MDPRFRPALAAAAAGDLRSFTALLDDGSGLATARSSRSHPTLLQFVVLDGGVGRIPRPEQFARSLIERGADLEEPLVAAASIGSSRMTDLLLGAGAPVEACAPWTPLEESVYWAHGELSRYLHREHHARVRSLRAAAGLGDLAELAGLLRGGAPAAAAGPVRFPWGTVSDDPQDVLDQALVIAAKNDQVDAMAALIASGARVNAFPPGIHEKGGALHLAALCGSGSAVDLLLRAGADPNQRDPEHRATPEGWARRCGHRDIADRLGRSVSS